MKNLLSALADRLEPYTPGEQPQDRRYIKLNTNENPYPPAEGIGPALQTVLKDASLRRYPRPECEDLRRLVAKQEGLPSMDYVYFANGSDEMLAFCFAAFFAQSEKPVRFPDITYSFYPVYCGLFSVPYHTVALRDDFSIDPDDYRGAGGGIVLPNPNAPTALALEGPGLRRILESHPDEVVLVDEAYVAFGCQSIASWVTRYPNLVVVRTLSKSHSLAGLRVGYCMAQPSLIEGVIRVKNSFNSYTLDTLAQTAAYEALSDVDYNRLITRRVIKTRERFLGQLREMGFTGPDSRANFVFVTHPDFEGEQLGGLLRKEGILVRHFSRPRRIDPYLRITIGTDEQMDQVVETLREILARERER